MRLMSTKSFPVPDEGPEQYVRALELAEGVEIESGGRTEDSADLLEAGQFELVANRLWAVEHRDADTENNLGCANAGLHEWDDAAAALERSAKAPGADRGRARRNIDLVVEAKAAS